MGNKNSGIKSGAASLSRRHFLKNTAIVSAAAWTPAFRIGVAEASACSPPPNFPHQIPLFQQAFKNWSTEIYIEDLWTCTPRSAAECIELANWAQAHGWRLRPRGAMHNWSPIHVTADTTCNDNVVLVSTTEYLAEMALQAGSPAAVRVQAGATMESLLSFLEQHGYGFNNVPAPGDITVGGALAIGAHGSAIPAAGEQRQAGHSFGSLSNLVLSITAIVWQGDRYQLRTYHRDHPHCKALLVHLGRAFIIEVVLQAGLNQNLRCQSFVDIPYSELMGPPDTGKRLLGLLGLSAPRTFQSFLEKSGRAEIIWFPFTQNPWLKVWSVAPTRPLVSRPVNSPYNYIFSDNMPDEVESMAREITSGNQAITPLFGKLSYAVTAAGLTATLTQDIWGASKNTLLYIKPSTLRITACGYAVTTRRRDIQSAVHAFTQQYLALVDEYQSRGEYPMNMPVEIRVNGLDQASEVNVSGAEPPVLSSAAPQPGHSDRDVVIWFNCLSFARTPKANEFYTRLEQWFHSHFGSSALVRPEWSKGWAYSDAAPWTSNQYLDSIAPDGYRAGRNNADNWDWAVKRLDAMDPHRVFTNDFIDRLLR